MTRSTFTSVNFTAAQSIVSRVQCVRLVIAVVVGAIGGVDESCSLSVQEPTWNICLLPPGLFDPQMIDTGGRSAASALIRPLLPTCYHSFLQPLVRQPVTTLSSSRPTFSGVVR